MSKEDIHRHMDAGTCWLCTLPVDPAGGRDGSTGAHWSCVEKLRAEVNDIAPPSELVLAVKACGGVKSHWVDTGTLVALCGDAPKNSPSARMKARGRWLKFKDQDPAKKAQMCFTCSVKYGALKGLPHEQGHR